MRAVVLLSGGLDSATCLAIARAEGRELSALTVDYGQRHRIEIARARQIAASAGVADHRIVSVDLRAIGGSSLTDELPVPKGGTAPGVIPSTYVPARNTVLLAIGLAACEVAAAEELFIGVNAVDYSGYPDCRPEFVAAFEGLARLATRAGVGGAPFRIRAPLSGLSKAEIIRRGVALGVDHARTHSCYDPDPAGRACGLCDSCRIRKGGFAEAGVPDPTEYAR